LPQHQQTPTQNPTTRTKKGQSTTQQKGETEKRRHKLSPDIQSKKGEQSRLEERAATSTKHTIVMVATKIQNEEMQKMKSGTKLKSRKVESRPV
jgi:hypothetical protein